MLESINNHLGEWRDFGDYKELSDGIVVETTAGEQFFGSRPVADLFVYYTIVKGSMKGKSFCVTRNKKEGYLLQVDQVKIRFIPLADFMEGRKEITVNATDLRTPCPPDNLTKFYLVIKECEYPLLITDAWLVRWLNMLYYTDDIFHKKMVNGAAVLTIARRSTRKGVNYYMLKGG